MAVQQGAQAAVLVGNAAGGQLDLGGGLDALKLDAAEARLEVLDVLLAPGARPALVVADAGEVRAVLCG